MMEASLGELEAELENFHKQMMMGEQDDESVHEKIKNPQESKEDKTLSYILRYEKMIRQQDIEGTVTLSHVLQLFREIQHLSGTHSEDDGFVTFKEMKKTLQLLEEDDDDTAPTTRTNESSATILIMMLSTDLQLITMLSTLVKAHDEFYHKNRKYLKPLKNRKEDRLSLAEFYHCYQIIMNAMQSLQVAAEPTASAFSSFSFSTPNQDYTDLSNPKTGDKLTSKILKRTAHLIECFFDPPSIEKPLVKPQQNQRALKASLVTREVKKTTQPLIIKQETTADINFRRNIIFLGAATLHICVCAGGYWWSVNVYDVSTGASSVHSMVEMTNKTLVSSPFESHYSEDEQRETEALKQLTETLKQEADAFKREADAFKREVDAFKREADASKQEAEASRQKVEVSAREADFLKRQAEASKREAEASRREAEALKHAAETSNQEEMRQLEEMEENKKQWKDRLEQSLQQTWQEKLSSIEVQRMEEQKQFETALTTQRTRSMWGVANVQHQLTQDEMYYQQQAHNLSQTYQQKEDESLLRHKQEQQQLDERIKFLQERISALEELVRKSNHDLEAQQNTSILLQQKKDGLIDNLKVQLWMQRYIDENVLQTTIQEHQNQIEQERMRALQEMEKEASSIKNALHEDYTNSMIEYDRQILAREQEEQEKRAGKEDELRERIKELEGHLMILQEEKEELSGLGDRLVLLQKELEELEYQRKIDQEEHKREEFEYLSSCHDDDVQEGEDVCDSDDMFSANRTKEYSSESSLSNDKSHVLVRRRKLWRDRVLFAIGGAAIVLIVPQLYSILGFGASTASVVAVTNAGGKNWLAGTLLGRRAAKTATTTAKTLSWMNLGSWNPRWNDMASASASLWQAFIGV
uniref:Uncharacterized protein n=1 Tax=Ditylum brightwellii TaxID=49249 RepID=A0A7S4QXL2_9STRA